MEALAVPSNVGEPLEPGELVTRAKSMVVFGQPGSRKRSYATQMAALQRACERLGISEVQDVGESFDGMPERVGSVPVSRHGVLGARDLSLLLADCVAGFVAYPRAFLAKSGVFAAYCAHRLMPVLPSVDRRPDADGIVGGVHYLSVDGKRGGEATAENAQAIADAAWKWYQGHSLKSHARAFARRAGDRGESDAGGIFEEWKGMKILLSSYFFLPSIGGVEGFSAMLAEQFTLRGHKVVVVTNTAGESAGAQYTVVRRPTKRQLFDLVRWCDVYLQNNISLNLAWPLLFCQRPWAIINNGIALENDLLSRVKRFCARFATTSGVSPGAARNIGAKTVVSSCYDSDVFRELPGVKRELELLFLGRLVSEKGVEVLLRALHQLKLGGVTPRLTIVGGGPEEASLRTLAASLGVDEQVTFAGVRRDEALVRELNRHKIMVAPSTCQEGLPIVALEGLACGCVLVGAETGLTEAIGPCGMTFPTGDATALANCLKELLTDVGKVSAFRDQAAGHLARFTKVNVADAYLKILQPLCQGSKE